MLWDFGSSQPAALQPVPSLFLHGLSTHLEIMREKWVPENSSQFTKTTLFAFGT